MAISFRTWPVLFTQSSPNIPNPPFSASNLSGIIIWTTGEETLSSMVASDALLIILSAVSSSAELLSSEIKTFVNLVAQQWRKGNHLGREARAGCWKGQEGAAYSLDGPALCSFFQNLLGTCIRASIHNCYSISPLCCLGLHSGVSPFLKQWICLNRRVSHIATGWGSLIAIMEQNSKRWTKTEFCFLSIHLELFWFLKVLPQIHINFHSHMWNQSTFIYE